MNKHIVLSILFVLFVALSFQKDENKTKTEESKDKETKRADESEETPSQLPTKDKEDTEDKGEKEKENEDTTPVIPERAVKLPEAKVLLPIRRIGTSQSILNSGPCGSITRREANTLTDRGSDIHVVWETVIPTANGNCTVKISPGLEKEDNFTVLHPKGSISNPQGVFPCGTTKGFEGHEFVLPDNYVCDKCTLQWKWSTPYGNIYSCSDIIINGEKIGNCLAKCQNGGSCFNGKCLCLEGFEGEFCQNKVGSGSDVALIILYVFLAILLLAILGYGIYLLTTKFFFSWLRPDEQKPSQPFSNNKDDHMIDGSS